MSGFLASVADGGRIVDIAGRQRMLSQRIALSAVQPQSDARDSRISSDLQALRRSHELLQSEWGRDDLAAEAETRLHALAPTTSNPEQAGLAAERFTQTMDRWNAALTSKNRLQVRRGIWVAVFLALLCTVAIAGLARVVFKPLHERLRSTQALVSEQIGALESSNQGLTIAHAAAERANAFIEAVLGVAGCVVCVVDREGRFVRFNDESERVTRWRADEVIGKRFWEIFLLPEERDGTIAAFQALRAGEFPNHYRNHWLTKDGEARMIEWHNTAILSDQGEVEFVIGTGVDVTARIAAELQIESQMLTIQEASAQLAQQHQALEAANARLESLALQDGLTGLANRRAFDVRLGEEFARWTRYATPFSLVLIDVDHFKSYNDEFGHLSGDEALTRVAAALRSASRDSDLVARYGGEEMAVVMPATDAATAASVAERIRAAIEAQDWPLRPVTASVGVSICPSSCQTPEEMIRAADEALYASKARGRNQVTVTP